MTRWVAALVAAVVAVVTIPVFLTMARPQCGTSPAVTAITGSGAAGTGSTGASGRGRGWLLRRDREHRPRRRY